MLQQSTLLWPAWYYGMPMLGPMTGPQQWEDFHLDKSLYLESIDVNG